MSEDLRSNQPEDPKIKLDLHGFDRLPRNGEPFSRDMTTTGCLP
jgi:hypothetical protein